MKFDIANFEFYLTIHLEFDFKDIKSINQLKHFKVN